MGEGPEAGVSDSWRLVGSGSTQSADRGPEATSVWATGDPPDVVASWFAARDRALTWDARDWRYRWVGDGERVEVLASAMGHPLVSTQVAPAESTLVVWTVAAVAVRQGDDVDAAEFASELLDWEAPEVTMADVAGLEPVKARLSLVLAPMRNAELAAAYKRKVSGGLLLWGPPGCGKTFIARALSGQLEMSFASISISDVLDMWIGRSERNLSALMAEARRKRPCVLFLDELDALGGRRSRMVSETMRSVVNGLLTELDGVGSDNDGLVVVGATNQPWDVDPALRRPGRFDRTVFVPPPDRAARREILAARLAVQPIDADVDLAPLVELTTGYTGADVAHLAETAIDLAFTEALSAGRVVPVAQRHLVAARKEVLPSVSDWVQTAQTAALASNDTALFGSFLEWLDSRQRW